MPDNATSLEQIERLVDGAEMTREEVFAARSAAGSDFKLHEKLHTRAAELRKEIEEVEEGTDKNSVLASLGLVLVTMGDAPAAAEALEQVKTRRECAFWLGYLRLQEAGYADASALLEKSLRGNDDTLTMRYLAEALVLAGQTADARKTIDKLEKRLGKTPDVIYLNARLAETEGDYAGAIAGYEQALEEDEAHPDSTFRLALNLDLNGEDERAIELYESLAKMKPTFTNALFNLGILYEDHGRHADAEKCYKQIVSVSPNNRRARSYLKDARSSQTMHIDEQEYKRRVQQASILNTPISEFELSVRSRNCLEKMNICTLGDLTRVTEAELLSYKNFGETSLNEIRQILQSKNLQLGQAVEKKEDREARRRQIEEANKELLNKPIAELNLSSRSRRCMDKLNIRRVEDLVKFRESDLLKVRNFGQTSVNEVKRKLGQYGLSLTPED